MKLQVKLALVTAALALGVFPAMAVAGVDYGPEYQPEHPTHPVHPTAPKGKAYGYYCKGESKKHVKGQQGTPFSRCVNTMARAAHNDALSAKKACKTRSKKHVKGEKGTAFSRCVREVNQMRRDARATVTASALA